MRGNNITLCSSLYERNELGELSPLPLAELDTRVTVYSGKRGTQEVPFKVGGANTIALNCSTDIFSVADVYNLEIVAHNVDSGQRIRFAYKSAVQVVEYADDLYGGCDCHTDNQGYTVVNIPPQIACGGYVKFSQYVAPGGIVTELELAPRVEAEVAKQLAELKQFQELVDIVVRYDGRITTAQTTADDARAKAEQAGSDLFEFHQFQTGKNGSTDISIQQLRNTISEMQRKDAQQDATIAEHSGSISSINSTLSTVANYAGENKQAIATLNGNKSVEGSVDHKIAAAINAFATALTDDGTVNTYAEALNYIATHGAEFTKLLGVVDNNSKRIENTEARQKWQGDEDYVRFKNYADYSAYSNDLSRRPGDISFVEQDNSIWVQSKQYTQNAGCFVGSNASGVSTTAWYLAGEATLAADYDLNIIGSVQRTLGNVSVLNNASYNGTGIFVLCIRSNGESATAVSRFQWVTKVGQVTNLRVVISGYNVKLYCQVAGGQYHFARISIFNQTSRITTNSTVLMKLSDNTTPETTEPVGTDIADAPYLPTAGGTVTGDLEVQGITKLKGWTYVDKPINLKGGEYAHVAYQSRGTAGYVKVATITINQPFADEPIYFEIMQRAHPCVKFRIQFENSNSLNPSLAQFTRKGTINNYYYLHQSASGVWDFYVQKIDAWTGITVSKVTIGGYSNGFFQSPVFIITWQDEFVTSVPEGSVASTLETEGLNITGNANSANQLVTSRKIGFANFNGSADVSLNTMQGMFSLRWATNTTQWQRIIRFKTNVAYHRRIATIAVGDNESMAFQGILRFGAATHSTTSNVSVRLSWLSLSVNAEEDFSKLFKAYVTYPSANDEYAYVDVYANSPRSYVNMMFNILSVSNTADLTFGGDGVWLEASEINGTLVATSTYEVFDEFDAIKARLAALEAKTTIES